MSEEGVLFGNPACRIAPPVQTVLAQAGVAYRYVDISRDPQGRRRVLDINRGRESVPTLEFPDGNMLTEPSLGELRARLVALGYQAAALRWPGRARAILESPTVRLSSVALMVVGVLNADYWVVAIGAMMAVLSRWLRPRS